MKKIFKQHVRFSSFVASIVCGALLAAPSFVFAANPSGGFTTLGTMINTFTTTVVKALGSLFIALGVVAFFYGMVEFIWAQRDGNGEKAKKSKSFMVWGLVGVFVMVSVWGIIKYFQTIFGLPADSNITIPKIQLGTASSAYIATV